MRENTVMEDKIELIEQMGFDVAFEETNGQHALPWVCQATIYAWQDPVSIGYGTTRDEALEQVWLKFYPDGIEQHTREVHALVNGFKLERGG